jgi:hypothetical protein
MRCNVRASRGMRRIVWRRRRQHAGADSGTFPYADTCANFDTDTDTNTDTGA